MAPGVILDVDGTLVDSNDQHALAWHAAFREHDVHVPVAHIHRHIGMGGDQLVSAVAGDEVERARGDELRAAHDTLFLATIETVTVLVMVGDTPWDVHAAARAQVPTVAVLTGGFGRAELDGAGASAVYESVAELRARLDESPVGATSSQPGDGDEMI